MMDKPYSQASENNKEAVLAVLRRVFHASNHILEIGSGTGQHAVFLSKSLPQAIWQPSDRQENIAGIKAWTAEQPQENLKSPIILDVLQQSWPKHFDAVFSANTAHIMSWEVAQHMVKEVARRLPEGGVFALYGPFNYQGRYTSESNARFEQWLKSVHPQQGIRHFEEINAVAADAGLSLQEDNEMPANNRTLVWSKR